MKLLFSAAGLVFLTLCGAHAAELIQGKQLAPGAAGASAGVVRLEDYGGKCDGVLGSKAGTPGVDWTDNTTAINNWLAQAGAGKTLRMPQGVCNFTGNIHFGIGVNLNHVTIAGAGKYSSWLQYAGAGTTGDLFNIGSGTVGDGSNIVGFELSGLGITSATKMTSGFCIHTWHVARAAIDIVVDGQDGAGNLYGGLWLDENDVISLPWVDIKAQADNLRVNGSRQSEDWWPNYVNELHLGHGKIGGYGAGGVTTASVAKGIHIGGGVGYFTCDDVDVIGNQYNLYIDTTITATGNQSAYLGSCAFDTPLNAGASVYVDDSSSNSQWQGGTKQLDIPTWIAGATNIRPLVIHNWAGGYVQIKGAIAGSTAGGPTNGVTIDDATAEVLIGPTAKIYNHTGYGVYSSIANPKISIASTSFSGNSLGDLNVNVLSSSLPIYYSSGQNCSVGLAIGGSQAGITYSTQYCVYQLTGYDVNVDYTLALSSKGSNTGALTLAALPIGVGSASGGGGAAEYYINWTGLTGALVLQAGALTTFANVYQSGATGQATVTNANLTNTSTLYGSLIYRR